MAINLLGGEEKIEKRKSASEIKMHLPEKEELAAKKTVEKKIEPPKPKEVLPEQVQVEEANLMPAFKTYRLKRRLTLIAISVIIIAGIAAGIWAYFSFFYRPSVPIVSQENINKPVINVNVNITPPPLVPKYSCNTNNGQCYTDENGIFTNLNDCQANCFVPTPSAVCGNGICESSEDSNNCPADCPPPAPQPLPNTELAPLRGAIVKFSVPDGIFLVENNGELRTIDKNTVVFANGKNINQISPQLIYTVADRFENTRRGKEVIGFVSWDPRVLTPEELEPYL